MKRMVTIWAIGLGLLGHTVCAEGTHSEWVRTGPDGKLVYKTTAAGDRIMDSSGAGYMGGGVALPTVPIRRTIEPSGGPDDTAAIQAAIDAVSVVSLEGGFRGAILLAPGTYVCSGTISIAADGVVLRDGRPQTWIRTGSRITAERMIAAISGNRMTLDIPLSDSFDSRHLNPPGTAVVKIKPAPLVAQVGVEHLHIQSLPMEISYSQHPSTAMRINGQDCWATDIAIEETMNSVSLSGRRITLQRVAVNRTVPNVGASKPAEFAPNASQVLLDRCSGNGDNIWHVATGGGHTGPIVLLNCTFRGTGHIEGHQRWTTGILLDNCRVPEGGIDFKNRGSMGSGHGWGTGWSVASNCIARTYVIQQPPGAINWAIGCIGQSRPTPRPFDSEPNLPVGTFDSPGTPVIPQSLYLAQLAGRLGPQAVRNIGY